MSNSNFEISENTLPIIQQMAEHMPGGFFIYHADGNEEFILVNEALLRLTECTSMEQFKALTKNSFRGFVHPEDLKETEDSIAHQIHESEYGYDYVEYRIRCLNGKEKWIRDYGHFTHTETFGDIFYVFVNDATEIHQEELALEEALEEQEAQLQEIQELNKELQSMVK